MKRINYPHYEYHVDGQTLQLDPHDIESIADEMFDKQEDLDLLTEQDLEFIKRYTESA